MSESVWGLCCVPSFIHSSVLRVVCAFCIAANVVSPERCVGHARTDATHMCVASSEPCGEAAVDEWPASMLGCVSYLHVWHLHVELHDAMRSQRAAICTPGEACGMSWAIYAEMMPCIACMADTGALGGRPTAQDTDSALRRSTGLANGARRRHLALFFLDAIWPMSVIKIEKVHKLYHVTEEGVTTGLT